MLAAAVDWLTQAALTVRVVAEAQLSLDGVAEAW
jgi:hypothetical protein